MLVPSVSSSQLVLASSLPSLPLIPVQPTQDALDVAISQSQKRLEVVQHEAIQQERRFFIFYGKKCHALEIESFTLRKELAAKQYNVEHLPKLYQEKWTAHLAMTHASMRALPEAIADFVKSFKQFQASFPAEAISKMPENAVPSQEWLTRLKAFVNARQASPEASPETNSAVSPSPLPQKVEAAQQLVPVNVNPMLVEAASISGVSPYLQELRTLEDHVAKVKGDVVVLEEREQSLRKQEAQAIESWNKVFVPYVDTANRFQEMVVKFLQQQNTSLSQCAEEFSRLVEILDSAWLFDKNREALRRLQQATPLHKQIDLIASLIEKMVLNQSSTVP